MIWGDLIWVLLITLILAAVFSILFGRPVRDRAFIFFFLILFLATWSGGLWVTPVGRPVWGVSWLTFLIVGIVVSLLLTALTPRMRKANRRAGDGDPAEVKVVIDAFFWVLVALLLLTILFGYL